MLLEYSWRNFCSRGLFCFIYGLLEIVAYWYFDVIQVMYHCSYISYISILWSHSILVCLNCLDLSFLSSDVLGVSLSLPGHPLIPVVYYWCCFYLTLWSYHFTLEAVFVIHSKSSDKLSNSEGARSHPCRNSQVYLSWMLGRTVILFIPSILGHSILEGHHFLERYRGSPIISSRFFLLFLVKLPRIRSWTWEPCSLSSLVKSLVCFALVSGAKLSFVHPFDNTNMLVYI